MSIASEIQRINTNIENAYLACEDKGATIPLEANSDNLADTINTITGGGGGQYIGVPRTVVNGVCQIADEIDTSVFQSITNVGLRGLSYVFYNCYSLEGELDLSSITQVSGYGGMDHAFSGTEIISVDLSGLTTISGTQGLAYTFSNCHGLRSIDLSNLTTISAIYGMYYCFQNCEDLFSVTFSKLSSIASMGLAYAFSYSEIDYLYFPELTTFGAQDVFKYMLQGCFGVTVHFPYALEATMSSWSDVISGFGGTGITILFDLKRAIVNFTTTPTADIYLRGTKIDGTTGYAPPGSADYVAYSSSINTLLAGTVTNLIADETTNVSVNLNQTSNKITLSTGVSGLSATFVLNGCIVPAVEESGGNYSINYIGPSGKNITYSIDGGNNYSNATGTITTTGSSITQNATINAATVSTFTRPTVSSGSVGGSSFAVYSTNTVSGYNTYAVVNSTTTDYVWLVNNSGTTSDLCFYNPLPLKVSAIGIATTSTTYTPSKIDVYGSNDGSLWTLISNHSPSRTTSLSISPNSTAFYKYHKLTLTGTSLRIKELTITAQQKG